MTNHVTVILKPTAACNLRCLYCYQSSELDRLRMNDETLDQVVKSCFSMADDVEFLWHGGEPLLMGLDFYKKVVELQQKLKNTNNHFKNAMQTNLTLLTPEMADFFKEHRFGLSTSLDGPKDLHDKLRPNARGGGSFDDVIAGIKLMRENKSRIGVITVLTRSHLDRLEDVYQFFKDQNIDTKVNPIFAEGRGAEAYDAHGITPEQYGKAMIQLFDLWFNDPKPTIKIDSLEKFYHGILYGKPRGCDFKQDCRASFISINYKGDLTPCGRFDGQQEFYLGNVFKDDAKEVLNKQVESTGKRDVESCKPCKWYEVCYSGCPHNAFIAHKTINAPDYFCTGIKMIYAHMEKVIDLELDKAEAARKARLEVKNGGAPTSK